MAIAPVGFSWVNYTSGSIVEKDEEDVSIIKSHAMRVVHRQRHKHPRKLQNRPDRPKARRPCPKAGSVETLVRRYHPFLHEPETDWEGLATCQFMEDFVYPQLSPDTAYQYLNFLPGLCNKYSDQSCLSEAILAVALARFANQNRAPDLGLRARKAYVAALTLVNESMKDPLLQKSDHVLATLCLLTKYEMVSGDPLDSGLWQSHERGQAALICQRGEEQLMTEIGAALFRLIYTRQCLNCIAQGQRPAMGLTSVCWQLAFPTPHLRKTMELIAEIANLRYAARVHNNLSSSATPTEACSIAQDAVRLDANIISFVNQIPPEMEYQRIPNNLHLPKDFERGYAPDSIKIFRDLQAASFWHVIWYGRIHVLQTLIQYSSYQSKFQSASLYYQLQETVNDVCESIPYSLSDTSCPKVGISNRSGGAVAAHYLIWVLATASRASGVPGAQRQWISNRLKYIGFAHGIRHALLFA